MRSWARQAAIAALVIISVVVAGVLGAAVFGFGYITVVEFLWPLEPDEAAGPQFARGIVLLGFAGAGFFAGCILGVWGCSVASQRIKASTGVP
jgi:hypothetical protein